MIRRDPFDLHENFSKPFEISKLHWKIFGYVQNRLLLEIKF